VLTFTRKAQLKLENASQTLGTASCIQTRNGRRTKRTKRTPAKLEEYLITLKETPLSAQEKNLLILAPEKKLFVIKVICR
jgi:hypothetical protein